MLIIRFLRVGKKNQPFYRVVVTDKKNPPRAGRFLEILGFVNPFTKEKQLKAERIKYWLSVGAKTSDTAHNLFVEQGIISAKKIPVHKKPKKKAEQGKAKAAPLPEVSVDVEVLAAKPTGEAAEAPKTEEQAPSAGELAAKQTE